MSIRRCIECLTFLLMLVGMRIDCAHGQLPVDLPAIREGLTSDDPDRQRFTLAKLLTMPRAEWREIQQELHRFTFSQDHSDGVRTAAATVWMSHLNEPISTDWIVDGSLSPHADLRLWSTCARSRLDGSIDAIAALRTGLESEETPFLLVVLTGAQTLGKECAPLLPELVDMIDDAPTLLLPLLIGTLETMPDELIPFHESLVRATVRMDHYLLRFNLADVIMDGEIPDGVPPPPIELGVEALESSKPGATILGAWILWRHGFPEEYRDPVGEVLLDPVDRPRIGSHRYKLALAYRKRFDLPIDPPGYFGGRRGGWRRDLDSPKMERFCTAVTEFLREAPDDKELPEAVRRAWRRIDPASEAPPDTRLGRWERFVPSWIASIDELQDRHFVVDKSFATVIADETVDPYVRRSALRVIAARDEPKIALVAAMTLAAQSTNASVRLLAAEILGEFDRHETLPTLLDAWRKIHAATLEGLGEPVPARMMSRDFRIDGFAVLAPDDPDQRQDWSVRFAELVEITLAEDRLRTAHRSTIGASGQAWTVRRSELNEIDRLQLTGGETLATRSRSRRTDDAVGSATSDAARDAFSHRASRLALVPYDDPLIDREALKALFDVDDPTVAIAALWYATRTQSSTIEWLPTIVDRFLGDTRRPWPVCLEAARLVTNAEGEAVRTLAASLDAKNPTSRILACLTLGEIGGAARSAIPKLEALAANADEIDAVRRAATTARERIESAR